jgi:gamma-glutamyltranspeptidase/glutathione hydrolase
VSALEEGGNAVDAAVAASFALAVTLPAAGNLGGGGFLLYRDPDGRAWFLDHREVAPAAATRDLYLDEDGMPIPMASRVGWKAAGVPGTVVGLAEAHRRWGKLKWADLLAPAIQLAEEGFPVSEREHRGLSVAAKAFAADPFAAEVFLTEEGAPLPVGALLRQPRLAATLRRIATEGDKVFREGPVVEDMVGASRVGGGILSLADFQDYQAVLRPVQSMDWKGMKILAVGPPSSGGIFLRQALALLEGRSLRRWGLQDSRTIQLLGEIEAAVFRDRNRWLGDPAGFDFSVEALTDPAYLAALRQSLSPNRYTAPDTLLLGPPLESTQTTHLSTVDGEGGAVALTTTLNSGYGAKVMAPGGFLMNNEMDDFATNPGKPNQFGLVQGAYNEVVPGRRPLSSMCPVIVVKNGKVDAVVGSPGGPTILTTVLQVLLHRYEFGMDPLTAVAAPRFHRQDRPPTLKHEAGRLRGSVRRKLRSLGQPLQQVKGLGDVNAIFRGEEGWIPVADPRHEGFARVAG